MITLLVNKILVFILCLAVVDIVREWINFLASFSRNTKMAMTKERGWLLALSLAYVGTIIFTGLL